MNEIRAMSPGKLGHGCNAEEVAKGMAREPHFVGVDAGSTDMGAYYMGTDVPFFHPMTVKQDLTVLLRATRGAGIPLIIGSAITTGTNALLEKARQLLAEVAAAESLQLKVAIVRAEQSPEDLRARLASAAMPQLGAEAPLTEVDLDQATTIVAQMGVEPLARALDTGADVVLAGRACDDALFAADPVRRGFDQGLALHMGKILECGSMSCVPGDLHGSLVGYLRSDHFVLEPPSERRACLVRSVASHTLYERDDPYLQPGPGGVNDLTESRFQQLDDRSVQVSGSKWVVAPQYLVKLEGVRFAGYRSICMTGIRDPILIEALDGVLSEVQADARARYSEGNFHILFRQYGRNAVMGSLEPELRTAAHELGLLIEVVADSQALADAVCMYVRGSIQHAYYPGIVATAGNLAYPFSPFTIPCGPVYQWHIDHLLAVADPCELFPMEVEVVGKAVTTVA